MSLLERGVLIALGVVLPLICFSLAARNYQLEPEWQSNQWNRYILFIPDGRAGFPFYPLLIYCMISLAVFVIRPATAHLLIMRLGLYSGIILALQYTLIQASESDSYFIVAVAVGLASNFVLLGIVKLIELIPRKVLLYGVVGFAVIFGIIILGSAVGGRSIFTGVLEWPIVVGVACLAAAPSWCVGVYTRASLLALKVNQNADPKPSLFSIVLAWIPWLGGYALAWKWSITNAIALYAALPTSSPSCYIATAAAAGHPKFVGSSPARTADGSTFPANQQLRRLKCAEIALATACPKSHRLIRRIYDHFGPPLARFIAVHPVLADLSFATLKPIEWITYGMLNVAVPGIRLKIRDLYR